MLFNSNDFLVFFSVFLIGYALVQGDLTSRNVLIVISSYVFYSGWDIRFTALLLFTTIFDFAIGRLMTDALSATRRKGLLFFSIAVNLGILGAFKYFNFFRESFEMLLSTFGIASNWQAWNVILPVGISFYTFQSMSYVIDVYRKEMPPSRNLIQFMAYVLFFPQLVAGPIERGTSLLPQFTRTLKITRFELESGLWLIVWGLFKKVVIADNLAPLVELVYQHPAISWPITAMGTIAFALQIYCDFSGYCDVASGIATVLGFKLMLNFNLPYFATSLRDFWRRWHISLSTWLRDYLYRPLGGSRATQPRTYLNLVVTMLIGGLWHGAALNFILWGLWHGLGLAINRLWGQNPRQHWAIPFWASWVLTQVFVLYGWMLFRAGSLDQIIDFTASLRSAELPRWWCTYLVNLALLVSPLLAMQIWQWHSRRLDVALSLNVWTRGVLQAVMLLLIVTFWQEEASAFIYFQF